MTRTRQFLVPALVTILAAVAVLLFPPAALVTVVMTGLVVLVWLGALESWKDHG